jgi:hypothetical protein
LVLNIAFQSLDLNVPDKGYSRNVPCALNLISTFLFLLFERLTVNSSFLAQTVRRSNNKNSSFLAQTVRRSNNKNSSFLIQPTTCVLSVHSTFANILKNIYKKVRKVVGIG